MYGRILARFRNVIRFTVTMATLVQFGLVICSFTSLAQRIVEFDDSLNENTRLILLCLFVKDGNNVS